MEQTFIGWYVVIFFVGALFGLLVCFWFMIEIVFPERKEKLIQRISHLEKEIDNPVKAFQGLLETLIKYSGAHDASSKPKDLVEQILFIYQLSLRDSIFVRLGELFAPTAVSSNKVPRILDDLYFLHSNWTGDYEDIKYAGTPMSLLRIKKVVAGIYLKKCREFLDQNANLDTSQVINFTEMYQDLTSSQVSKYLPIKTKFNGSNVINTLESLTSELADFLSIEKSKEIRQKRQAASSTSKGVEC